MKDLNPENDYLSTKEFAEIVGVTTETLRHYARIGLLEPAKTVEKVKNKYYLYSPTQITTIKMIKVLSEIGVKLETIRTLAENRTPEGMLKLLHKHENIVADEMRFLHKVSSVIGTFHSLLSEGISATESEFTMSEVHERNIILGKANDFRGSTGFFREYVRFCNSEQEPKLDLSYPIGGYFENMDIFLNEPSQPSRFFTIDPNGRDIIPQGLYLQGFTRGYYGVTGDLPERMVAFAKKNSLVFTGPVYNIYLFDEVSVTDPTQYLLQISAAVKATKRVQSRRPLRSQ
jgi:DNA-binding transcriptional MerR regulator